jgi:hypothetical protein
MKGWVGQARLMTTQWVNHRLLTESHKYPSTPPPPSPTLPLLTEHAPIQHHQHMLAKHTCIQLLHHILTEALAHTFTLVHSNSAHIL